MEDNKIKVGITQGDINGVGYEVILKAFSDPVMLELCTPVIYGSPKVAAYHRKSLDLPTNFSIVSSAAEAAYNRLSVVNCTDDEVKVEFSKADHEAGKAALGALERAIEEYKEGLIDPEIFTRGMSARDTLLSNNTGGFTHDWVSTGSYNDSLGEEIPGFQMVAIAPLKDQNGNVKERDYRYAECGWGISSQCKDPESVIEFMDFMFTEEGSDLMNWGVEGKTYTVDDNGGKAFTE